MSPLPIKLLLRHRNLMISIGASGHLGFAIFFAPLTLVWCAGHDVLVCPWAFSRRGDERWMTKKMLARL